MGPQAQGTTTRQTTTTAAPDADAGKQPKGAVESVVDYGTGYTQLQVKKRSSQKLDDIAAQRNREIDSGSR